MYKYLFILTAALLLSACATPAVQSWDRGILAKQEMQIVPDTLQYYYEEHTYFSREASIGGTGSGGGGCGCN